MRKQPLKVCGFLNEAATVAFANSAPPLVRCNADVSCISGFVCQQVSYSFAVLMKLEAASGPTELSQTAEFPRGLHNAFWFAGFNALSYQIVLSSPMILYAKTLGASATVLGILAAMMPLLVIFQIPAASYIPRVGYKRFVYGGWGIRVMFIFFMALVPLLSFIDAPARLALMLLLLFGFNLSRGISSCAWLPWISSLVPASVRGRFLAIDAAWINCGSFITIIFAAICLGKNPSAWQFSVLFAFSALTGAASLVFLKRIPEAETPEQGRTSTTPVPWREIANYAPFRKLLRMIIGWAFASGGITTFTVAFMKVETNLPEGTILLLTSAAFIGGLSSLWFLGPRLDRLGSKPILIFSFLTYIVILLGWFGMAAQLLFPGMALICFLQFLSGLASSLVGMANTRLAMAIIPQMGRNHFFALYSVVANVTLGISPIVWGVFIDAFRPVSGNWLGIEWTRYTIVFLVMAISFLVTIILSRRLHEPQAASFEQLLREILIQSPQRVWVRLWPRF